jgi:hypothetical protein
MAHSQVRLFLVAPTANTIFNRQVKKVCAILIMRVRIADRDLLSPRVGYGIGLRSDLFQNLSNFDQPRPNPWEHVGSITAPSKVPGGDGEFCAPA